MDQYVLPAEVEALNDGRFLAYSEAIEGCHAEGDTLAEALDNLQDVARALLETMTEDGVPWPKELRRFETGPLHEELLVYAPRV